MRCLDDEKIQLLIDGELSIDKEQIELHLSNCEYCKGKVQEHKQLSERIKNTFDLLVENEVAIRPNKYETIRKVSLHPFRKKIVYIASAACIALLISFFVIKNKEKETIKLLYNQNETYTDANKSTLGQDFIITAINPKGEHNEYIIE